MAKKKMSREELKEFKGGKYMGGPAEERAEKKGKRAAMGGMMQRPGFGPDPGGNTGVAPPRGGMNPNKGYERPGMKGPIGNPNKGFERPGMKGPMGNPNASMRRGEDGDMNDRNKGVGRHPEREAMMNAKYGKGSEGPGMYKGAPVANTLPRPDLGGGFQTRPGSAESRGPFSYGLRSNNSMYAPGESWMKGAPSSTSTASLASQFQPSNDVYNNGMAVQQTYKKGGRVKRMDAGGPVVSTPLPPVRDKMARKAANEAERTSNRRSKLTDQIGKTTSKFDEFKTKFNAKNTERMADMTGDKLATFKTRIADKLANRTGNYNERLGRLNSRLSGMGPAPDSSGTSTGSSGTGTTPAMRGGGLARKGVGQALARGGLVKANGCAARGKTKGKIV